MMRYISHILVSSNFNNKNKLNLLKFIQLNVNLILSLKDQAEKCQKLLPLLLLTLIIVQKFNDIGEIPIDTSILEEIQQISFLCWGIQNNHIVLISASIFAYLFKFKSNQKYYDHLVEQLFDNITNIELMYTISAVIGLTCKYNSFD